MLLMLFAALFGLGGAALAQDSLSPPSMDSVKLGADYDGRKELCRVLVKATERAGPHRVLRCTNHGVLLAGGKATPCTFIQQRSGAVLYVDETVVIRKGARPTSTGDLQARLERVNVTTVSGLLQAFDFTSVSQEDGATVELHYNNCTAP